MYFSLQSSPTWLGVQCSARRAGAKRRKVILIGRAAREREASLAPGGEVEARGRGEETRPTERLAWPTIVGGTVQAAYSFPYFFHGHEGEVC